MGQDSVFIIPSEFLRGLDGFKDEDWVDAGPQVYKDPDNDEAHWITVIIPQEMNHTHSDEEIMKYMLHNIRARRAIVSASAQHNLGISCISVPVKIRYKNTATVLSRAEADVSKWLELVCGGTVTLDREVIFGR
ncbi:uncharacterized protein N7500_004832 [Penicillium coprophilum]|uniref:uncharacterized protein n=1 Tax=Penicillium coprophilum TaxID=36646 RepID=UPI00239A9927|nr:uncharacterized protein N7500_004832 [Penicillium coprophilum]KAJ5163002.1 hypothetical protein N7500_004832 [Penicillium coprophilum]